MIGIIATGAFVALLIILIIGILIFAGILNLPSVIEALGETKDAWAQFKNKK